MLIVRSDAHRAHHCLELDGARLIPSWETPIRADHVDRAVDEAGTHTVVDPGPFPTEVAAEVHDPDYLAFLATAWDR